VLNADGSLALQTPGVTPHLYDSRLATSVMYFSYSAREIKLPQGGLHIIDPLPRANGVSHVERGTNSDG
jgi:hypothetical protein